MDRTVEKVGSEDNVFKGLSRRGKIDSVHKGRWYSVQDTQPEMTFVM